MHVKETAEAAEAHLAANACLVSIAAYFYSRRGVDKIEDVQNLVLASWAASQAACCCVELTGTALVKRK